MKQDKSQKSEVGQEARDAWARALLKSADKHNDERLRGLANEISSEGKETKSRGINMVRIILLICNGGFFCLLLAGYFNEFVLEGNPLDFIVFIGGLCLLLFFLGNIYYIYTRGVPTKESLFGLWLEVRKKKLRKQLEED